MNKNTSNILSATCTVIGTFCFAFGIIFLMIWSFGSFHREIYGNCITHSYDINPGSCECVYETCKDCYCVSINAYYELNNSIRMIRIMTAYPYAKNCWTTDSQSAIEKFLNRSYPIDGQYSCYQDGVDGRYYVPSVSYKNFSLGLPIIFGIFFGMTGLCILSIIVIAGFQRQ